MATCPNPAAASSSQILLLARRCISSKGPPSHLDALAMASHRQFKSQSHVLEPATPSPATLHPKPSTNPTQYENEYEYEYEYK